MTMTKPGADYQVFLSFRGPDTRQGFTDCLYHFMVDAGIRVFRDNEELHPGERIEKILSAINSSIVCIPIFSKDYASSKWCLREIAEMVERKKIIMPVFYDVSPDDVKLKTCLYHDAMINHGKENEEKEQWQVALKKAVEISGWESSRDKEEKALKVAATMKGWELKNIGYGELCKSIVKEVLVNLKVKHKVVTDHLIGVQERVRAVLRHSNVQVTQVRYIGIYGLGGSGKTTLAKVVFNKLYACFDACSFLSNVRESSINGLVQLQEKLLCDLTRANHSRCVSDTDDGIKKIKDICRNKKVLIVLDNVDSREQIDCLAGSSNWFSSGSRIIVTMRDIGLLAANQEGLEQDQSSKEVCTLEMKEMDFKYALQLFSRHAFKTDFPPPEYLQLSKDVVSAIDQFPLTLEIIGSYLYGKPIEVWEDKRNSLIKIPPKDILKKLMMSYENLDFRTKQIFLDIACFTSDLEKQNAIYMWRSCGFRPEIGLKELISKSLVKFCGDTFLMHDHLRDLGREIICTKNFMDLGARSRLCNHKEAFGTLMRKEGTRKIEVLHLSSDVSLEDFSLTPKHFRNLPNLRYLSLGQISLEGDFEHLFSKLRWLSWEPSSDFNATNLNLEQLAILDLSSGYDIGDNWKGWGQIQLGDQLAVMDLSNSRISKTPDLSQARSLERLILRCCFQLSEIDGSIGNLKRLKHLNLNYCKSLRGLPEEIGSLESLEEIFLRGSCIIELPQGVGKLKKLKCLSLKSCDELKQLPETIGDAKSLLELDLSGSGICELPKAIGDMESLTELDLSETKITGLPNSFGGLKKLKRLHMGDCHYIKKLPDSFGGLKSLSEMDISFSAISELPSSLAGLKKLKRIRMNGCNINETQSSTRKKRKREVLSDVRESQ